MIRKRATLRNPVTYRNASRNPECFWIHSGLTETGLTPELSWTPTSSSPPSPPKPHLLPKSSSHLFHLAPPPQPIRLNPTFSNSLPLQPPLEPKPDVSSVVQMQRKSGDLSDSTTDQPALPRPQRNDERNWFTTRIHRADHMQE
ncbi:unnamed protein product [Lota lota]